ncbi:MAG: hypothetical protein HY078_02945 [Elusimicrobia bacterium]|nr:hypothetical protein [Elusimicrobiota bacterium]
MNTKRMFKVSHYQYVALNLARDIIEFGASANFGHRFKFRYYYPPATNCLICNDGSGCGAEGASGATGYQVKEWSCFGIGNPHPFRDLGDIKERNLVPKQSPYSVVILYETMQDPNFYNAYRHHVNISWEEDGTRHSRDLSTISMSQVNDQLHLELSEFTWRQK